MSVDITRPGKMTLTLPNPVMPAAGTFGWGQAYRDLVHVDKLGAVVTNPVTFAPWQPAGGTRVVALPSGVLVHTGLPNPGLSKVIKRWRDVWALLPVPLIVHLVATIPDEVQRAMARLEVVDSVAAVELGLNDDLPARDAAALVRAATRTDKPVLARLPLGDAYEIAGAVAEAGAAALVVAAPPRGTARDAASGRLIGGRVYGPLVKPLVLRVVGVLARRLGNDLPIIGAGGIHSAQDARDYLDAGARAVQVDSLTWVQPHMLEVIARDLGGLVLTREAGALADEWFPGIGNTARGPREEE